MANVQPSLAEALRGLTVGGTPTTIDCAPRQVTSCKGEAMAGMAAAARLHWLAGQIWSRAWPAGSGVGLNLPGLVDWHY